MLLNLVKFWLPPGDVHVARSQEEILPQRRIATQWSIGRNNLTNLTCWCRIFRRYFNWPSTYWRIHPSAKSYFATVCRFIRFKQFCLFAPGPLDSTRQRSSAFTIWRLREAVVQLLPCSSACRRCGCFDCLVLNPERSSLFWHIISCDWLFATTRALLEDFRSN